jgi:hypothetical protein
MRYAQRDDVSRERAERALVDRPASTDEALTPRHRLLLLAQGALYVVSVAALMRGLRALVDNPLTHTVLGAAAVSLVATHAGVRSEIFGQRALRRALIASAVVVAVSVVAVAAAVASGGSLVCVSPTGSALFGVVEAIASGYGREMWLAGIPLLIARRAGVPTPWALGFVIAANVGAVVLEPGARLPGLVLTGASSAFFASAWLRGGDPYAPVVGHVVWVWLADAALAGELLVLSGAGVSAAPSASGAPTWAAAVAFAVAAAAVFTNVVPLARHAARDFPADDAAPAAARDAVEPPAKKKRKRSKPTKPKHEADG